LNETTLVVGMDDNTSEEEHVPNVNKAQFVDQLAKTLRVDRKRAAAALDAVIDNVYAAIDRGERVAITGFGVFERRDRAARTGRNPATGASVEVPASRVPAFRPGAEFKEIAKGAPHRLKERSEQTQKAVASTFGRAAAAVTHVVASATRAPATKSAQKSAVKKATAKKSTAKKSTAKKAAKKAPAKKSTAKKAPAKKSTAKKSTAKKAPAKKSTAKKSTAKKTAKKSAKKAPAKKR
jgi:DNA-binding protein HU-beta